MSWGAPRSGSRFPANNGCERSLPLLLGSVALLLVGCVSVKAPDKIIIGDSESKRVDAGRVPTITTVEEGRTELDKAYRSLRLLENENRELAREKDELKRERNRYKHERDECREKAEKSNDD